jgi:hypothetical protein
MIYSAAMPKRGLKFLLYSIHGHLAMGVPDYLTLFRSLTSLKGHHHEEGKRQIAIGTAMLVENQSRLLLIVYTGDKEKSILFFDLNEQTEFNELTSPGRFLARKTRVLIDPAQRRLLIESGRGCLSAEELAKIIETEAHKKNEYRGLELSFTPVAAQEFMAKISQMERIQSASVSIARPNVDWNDSYKALAGLADDSKGKAIDTTIRARRGDSLSKDNGLIPSIKHWLSDKLSAVASATIKGSSGDDSGLITLKLNDYVETLNVVTDVQPETGQPLETTIDERLNSYLDAKSKEDA